MVHTSDAGLFGVHAVITLPQVGTLAPQAKVTVSQARWLPLHTSVVPTNALQS